MSLYEILKRNSDNSSDNQKNLHPNSSENPLLYFMIRKLKIHVYLILIFSLFVMTNFRNYKYTWNKTTMSTVKKKDRSMATGLQSRQIQYLWWWCQSRHFLHQVKIKNLIEIF